MTARVSDGAGGDALGRLVDRGSALLREGKPSDARELLEQAVRLAPEDATARHLLALSCFQVGHLERALLIYQALALELPGSSAAKLNLAVVLLKLGRASVARGLLSEIVASTPDHRRAWGYLGVALEQLGLVHEAEEALIAGHLTGAAKRLRQRHAELFAPHENDARPEVAENTRRTLPVNSAPERREAATPGWLKPAKLRPFAETLPPPPTPTASALLEEISFEQTLLPSLPQRVGGANGTKAKPKRALSPLLDNALSSLLVAPPEASVGLHPTGLLMVGLAEGADAQDGGFAARADAIHAVAGSVRRAPVAERPFVRLSGTGRVVLAPPPGARLVPLALEGELAFMRESKVVAFDHALLHDLAGSVEDEQGAHHALVRFRGDGVVVLGLEGSFVSFELSEGEGVSVRASSLVGWLGVLTHERVTSGDEPIVLLRGRGTVLFGAR